MKQLGEGFEVVEPLSYLVSGLHLVVLLSEVRVPAVLPLVPALAPQPFPSRSKHSVGASRGQFNGFQFQKSVRFCLQSDAGGLAASPCKKT